MNTIISTDQAPAAIGPYSQAVLTKGGMLFVSGQIPIVPATGEIATGGIKEQTKQVLDNLTAIAEKAGFTLADTVKCTVYIKDMNDFAVVNEVYGTYFKTNPPARVCVEVSRLPKDVLVEIDLIASK